MRSVKDILNRSFLSHVIYFIILIGIIVFTIFGDSGLYQLHALKEKKLQLKYDIKQNRRKIDLLKREKIKLTNPEYLERIIRNELGYIKEGEIVYQITPKEKN